MGAGQSKEEALYQAVKASNHQAVKKLRREGASLEFMDEESRTPLILACTCGDLYDMVITLLNEGANLNSYRPGPHGGFPLHHAAKRGLDKTVLLLLSRGADPLAVNDAGLTPLDMARNKSHLNVVRIIEERICLFRGTMRELSGPGFLEIIVPQLITRKIWAVVLPAKSDGRKLPHRNELFIYQNQKVAIPRTVISLSKAEIEEPKYNQADPTMIITATDKTTKVRLKFQSELEGDKAQLERFYDACARGIRQPTGPSTPTATQGLQALMRQPGALQSSGSSTPTNVSNAPNTQSQLSPSSVAVPSPPGPAAGKEAQIQLPPPAEPIPDEIALAIAINASIASASAEGIPVSPSAHRSSWDPSRNKWGQSENGDNAEYGGWAEGTKTTYSGWGPGSSAGAGPSRLGPSVVDSPSTSEPSSVKQSPVVLPILDTGSSSVAPSPSVAAVAAAAPSAPPLPQDGPIHYPSVDTSPVQVHYPSISGLLEGAPSEPKAEEKSGQCVVCWDAAAEAVCIPCGHLAGCMDCLTEIKSKDWGCPVCRAPIQQVVKVYAV